MRRKEEDGGRLVHTKSWRNASKQECEGTEEMVQRRSISKEDTNTF